MAKIKWEVAEAPTGPYRSFYCRMWPSGHTDCNMYFSVRCADEYIPKRVKTGQHAPLKLAFRDDAARGMSLCIFKREFATLAELKEFAAGLNIEKLRA